MSKKPLTDKDGEVRELTAEDFKLFKRAHEILPPELLAVLPKRKPGQRGKQKTPIKEKVSVRLDQDIVRHFRSMGAGWQTSMNDALRKIITQENHP